jgi:hypothetical protein
MNLDQREGRRNRQELDQLEGEVRETGDDTYLSCMVLCIVVAAYIAVDVAGRWPTDADVREIARHTASAQGSEFSQDDARAFISRVALGGERMADVSRRRMSGWSNA